MPRELKWLGLDIGGANCKFASSTGEAWNVPFPLWKHPDGLADLLFREVHQFANQQAIAGLAVTMTGELADCFSTKAEGVIKIVEAIPSHPDWDLRIFQTDGQWASRNEVLAHPILSAASNWLALGTLVARKIGGTRALLVDVGSTTTDIIPLENGLVTCHGRTDPERLLHQELIYVGAERTPLCSLTDQGWIQGQPCGIARELFATTLDAYLWRGEINEREKDHATADGRPATRDRAFDRLARMVGADRDLYSVEDADRLATTIHDRHCHLIASGIQRLGHEWLNQIEEIIWSGQADFLAQPIAQRMGLDLPVLYLSDLIGAEAARCAPAYSVACLASKRFSNE
jgi:probable H4MPT-linked C1 transfer pathway protein